MAQCPCGSRAEFSACCEPYLTGKAEPPTAEAQMRARYSAYATHKVEYIEATHLDDDRDDLSVEETRKWAEESKWLGLKILGTQKGKESDTEGVVEFIATYERLGQHHNHRETSTFEKKNGKWFFKDGQVHKETITRAADKVGRNDPCPCGSGKKYKKCCG